ncbi:MAG: hypothetical protein ACK502_02795 [Alphaproteobacteria bacterium]
MTRRKTNGNSAAYHLLETRSSQARLSPKEELIAAIGDKLAERRIFTQGINLVEKGGLTTAISFSFPTDTTSDVLHAIGVSERDVERHSFDDTNHPDKPRYAIIRSEPLLKVLGVEQPQRWR